MLPIPISAKRKQFRRVDLPHRQITSRLLRPARATNLALLLLISACFISLFFNLYQWYRAPTTQDGWGSNDLLQAFSSLYGTPRPSNFKSVNHLVMVPCHAIWNGTDVASRLNDNDWLLETYQKGGNRVVAFFEHISRGYESSQGLNLLAFTYYQPSAGIAVNDEHSLLVFSGGQTRPSSITTEADSYLRLALGTGLLTPQFLRVTTENHALDSYQNLLFSIARFREYTGHFPNKITVIGYEFKSARFTDLHRVAIRWPDHRFHYIGVDPDNTHNHNAAQGELQNGYFPYSQDLYGCHSLLLHKRRTRNPFARFHSYYTSSPELANLLSWCPSRPTTLFHNPLPWDNL